jgi:phage shock protein PspC (stress-responsive transcriptional regulator)
MEQLIQSIHLVPLMKRLYRSKTERLLGGICGGIGQYYDTDPNLIRILWVVLTLLSIGIGVIAYIVAWIIIPEEPEERG